MLRLIPALLVLWLLVAGVRAETTQHIGDGVTAHSVDDYAGVGSTPTIRARMEVENGSGGLVSVWVDDGWDYNINLGLVPQEEEALDSQHEVRLSIRRWFPESEWATAECIVERESGWNPWAIGRAGERGLMQIHPIHFWAYDADRLFEIDYNIAVAHDMWTGSGWRPWLAQEGRCW